MDETVVAKERDAIDRRRVREQRRAQGFVIRNGYRWVFRPNGSHPLVKSGTAAEHRLVLWDKIGPGTHSCHWCGKDVSWFKNLQCDHVDWNKLNNDPGNLVPSCQPCNFTRHNPNSARRQRLYDLSREEIRLALTNDGPLRE